MKLNGCSFYNYNTNKYRASFIVNENLDQINLIKLLEENILNRYESIPNKSYKLFNYINSGYIKMLCFDNPTHKKLILKISGVWFKNEECGVTYKFVFV